MGGRPNHGFGTVGRGPGSFRPQPVVQSTVVTVRVIHKTSMMDTISLRTFTLPSFKQDLLLRIVDRA